MPSKEDRQIDLIVVVSGQPQPVRVNANQTVEHLVHEALKKSGNHGQPPESWELRTDAGASIDQALRVGQAGLSDGMTLFLNPQAGVGGNR
jgi:hypothetical protein